MPQEMQRARLAVLIDGENVPPSIAPRLFKQAHKLGNPVVRRIFGNARNPQMVNWESNLRRFAIIPRHSGRNAKGKNSADISLAIEAMDLLYGEKLDGFCLVSCDSDFTQLAIRIRESGLSVYGIGSGQAPESLKNSCDQFIQVDFSNAQAEPLARKEHFVSAEVRTIDQFVTLLTEALGGLSPNEGWYSLSEVGSQIRRIDTSFRCKDYGKKLLADLIRQTRLFEVAKRKGGSMQIRRRIERGAQLTVAA